MKINIEIETTTIPNEQVRSLLEAYLTKHLSYAELVEQIGDTAATNSLLSMLLRYDPETRMMPLAKGSPKHD